MFEFLKVKRLATQHPTIKIEPIRYQERPLLIILERYVLSCIGENDDETNITAVVQKAWGGGQDWKQTVRQELELPESIDEAIRGIWAKNQLIAKHHETNLHPIQFAKMFVDSNFVHLVDKARGDS